MPVRSTDRLNFYRAFLQQRPLQHARDDGMGGHVVVAESGADFERHRLLPERRVVSTASLLGVPEECQIPTQEHPTPTKTKGRAILRALDGRTTQPHQTSFGSLRKGPRYSITSVQRRLLTLVVAFLLVAQTLFAQGLSPAKPETVGMSSERLGRLTEVLQAYVDDGRLAGAVAIVARHGKIAYLEAVGHRDKEAGSPMATDTIFRIASQTKALVSAGVMMLQEEGTLLITDPVGKYLPEFMATSVAQPNGRGGYDVVAAKRPITIRDLLTHTAGISYGSGPAADKWEEAGITGWYFANRDEPAGDVMARLAKLPLDAHPGERWIYGYNTDILGAMIEKISGQTLGAFLREGNLLLFPQEDASRKGPVRCRERLGGLLKFYHRAAA